VAAEEKTTNVVQKVAQPITVKLKRGVKTYTWEVAFQGDNADAVLYGIDYIDDQLRQKYSQPPSADVFEKHEKLIRNAKKAKLEGGEAHE
jgi:hypothetical protein